MNDGQNITATIDASIPEENIKREITYTAYGTSIENTIRLLKCNKNINMQDQKYDVRAR